MQPGAEAMALSKIDIALALMEPLVYSGGHKEQMGKYTITIQGGGNKQHDNKDWEVQETPRVDIWAEDQQMSLGLERETPRMEWKDNR